MQLSAIPRWKQEVGTTGTEVNVYVAVNSGNGFAQGLTEGNFRLTIVSGGDVFIRGVQSLGAGAYLLNVARADDGMWRWRQVTIGVTAQVEGSSATTLVRIDIP